MVDAIAAASQREAEAHEKAITLSKENDELHLKLEAFIELNDELQSKLKALIEEKNSLIEMYERAASESNHKNSDKAETAEQTDPEIHNNGGSFELANVKEIEMEKVVKNLQQQLMEMHEENEKLMGLYEKAMHERDEFKRMLSSGGQNIIECRELDCPENLVEVGGESLESCVLPIYVDTIYSMEETGLPGLNVEGRGGNAKLVAHTMFGKEVSRLNEQDESAEYPVHLEAKEEILTDFQVNELAKSVDPPNCVEANTSDGLVQSSAIDNDENMYTKGSEFDMHHGSSLFHGHHQVDAKNQIHFGTSFDRETKPSNVTVVKLPDLNLVNMKLEIADEKLSNSAKILTVLGSVEKAFAEFDKLFREIEATEEGLQVKQQEFRSLELLSSEIQERKALADKKLSALRYSLSSFSSSVAYFEQREARARARVNGSTSYLDQKKEELVHLHVCKGELEAALGRIQHSEVELRNRHAILKSKLEVESKRQENEKVLFEIENIGKEDMSQRNWQLGGKATELLKSEEEKTKLQSEMKLSREKLGLIRSEFEDLSKKFVKIESEMQVVQMEIKKGSKSVEEMELALQIVIQEKETLLEIREKGMSEIQSLVLEYQQHIFDAELKGLEMKILEEELLLEVRRIKELRMVKLAANEKMTKLMEDANCHSCFLSKNMEEELQGVQLSILQAKTLLGDGNSNRCFV